MEQCSTLEELREALAESLYGAPVTAEYAGKVYRCSVGPDEYASVMDDGDWYGALAPITDRWYHFPPTRPDGFDGRARKIHTRDGDYWWQPPADVTDEHLSAMRENLTELLEWGYSTVALELLDGTDAYGSPIVVQVASLGAVDLTGNEPADVLGDVLGDLLAELLG